MILLKNNKVFYSNNKINIKQIPLFAVFVLYDKMYLWILIGDKAGERFLFYYL